MMGKERKRATYASPPYSTFLAVEHLLVWKGVEWSESMEAVVDARQVGIRLLIADYCICIWIRPAEVDLAAV